MDLIAGSLELKNFDKINIVLGKNGCGKSTLLKSIDTNLSGSPEWLLVRYITPERGGVLTFESNIEQQMLNNPSWFTTTRKNNQFNQFRQQTMVQYRKLLLSVLQEIEVAYEAKTDGAASFKSYLDQLNSLLDNIEIRRSDQTFKIFKPGTEQNINPDSISSGESELISLGIECLAFSREVTSGTKNLLILDEPDVHLHPDLQERLMDFLSQLVADHDFQILLATHSTAILGALSKSDNTSVAFMKAGDQNLTFHKIDEEYRKILPVFGAHPLSNIFNSAPALIVEGEDDERVWQRAVRSSSGRIKLYPISCEGVPQLPNFEKRAKEIIQSVYDKAVAYSIRDGDGVSEQLDDDPPITRMRLSCRAVENLVLTDEVLSSVDLTWDQVKARIEAWIVVNPTHSRTVGMTKFRDDHFPRKDADLKDIRGVLVGSILDSNKDWEILVGIAIGKSTLTRVEPWTVEGSMCNFLGEKVSKTLLPAG